MPHQTKLSLWLASLLTVVLVTGVGCGNAAPQKTAPKEPPPTPVAPIAGFVSYDEQSAFSFKFQIPKDWTKDETAEATNITTAFYAPIENTDDIYRENFVATAITIPKNEKLSLDEFIQASQTSLQKSLSDVMITDTGEAMLSDQKARTFIFTGNINNENGAQATIKGEEYYVIKGDHAYAFTFAGADSKFDDYQGMANQIFGSVELN